MSKMADLEIERINAMPEGTIGERIKRARTANGLFQEELGERIGKVRATVVQYEGDKILPPIDVIEAIARVLNVSASYLAFNSNENERQAASRQIALPIGVYSAGRLDWGETVTMPAGLVAGYGWPDGALRIFQLGLAAPHYRLNDGDLLVVHTDCTEILADGKLYAVASVGGVMVLRSEALPEGNDSLLQLTGPSGQAFSPTIPPKALGRVLGWIHAAK